MKNNKNIKVTSYWNQWVRSPNFSKNLLIIEVAIIILLISLWLLWPQYSTSPCQEDISFSAIPQEKNQSGTFEKTQEAGDDLKTLSNRLAAIENQAIQSQETLQISYKLIAIELFKGVLEGWVPFETLKTFLQKRSEPWSQDILSVLGGVKEVKTYRELENLFIRCPFQPISTWQKIKNTLKSFIRIRKVDENNESSPERREEIQKALRAHDIQKALKLFDKLSPQEKTQLSSWKEFAEGRLIAELNMHQLVLELAGN